MANLSTDFVGIRPPNPFWPASAPPTDQDAKHRRAAPAGRRGRQEWPGLPRACRCGWGGVVWRTLGSEGPPVVNVNGPRYGVVYGADRRGLGPHTTPPPPPRRPA